MKLHPIEEPDMGRGGVGGYECLHGGSGSAPSRLAGWLPSPDTVYCITVGLAAGKSIKTGKVAFIQL